ncbi:MAG: hypothetical protein ACOYZ8_09645 [Chloroflexota bacterium]
MAGLMLQSPLLWDTRPRWFFGYGSNTGIGLGKIHDDEMESTDERNGGLGLRAPGSCTASSCPIDQADPHVAFEAMERRISINLEACSAHKCTETDMFLTAALAQNAPSITPRMIDFAFGANRADKGPTALDWKGYLTGPDQKGDLGYNVMLIQNYKSIVLSLARKGYPVPNVDWGFVDRLLGAIAPPPVPLMP